MLDDSTTTELVTTKKTKGHRVFAPPMSQSEKISLTPILYIAYY